VRQTKVHEEVQQPQVANHKQLAVAQHQAQHAGATVEGAARHQPRRRGPLASRPAARGLHSSSSQLNLSRF